MGILDAAMQSPDDVMDPRSQGILKAAFALMAAGAPTRTPTGMGEALGQAGTAGIDAYEKAKQGQAAELQRKLQSAKLASELQMQQDLEKNGGILNSTDPEKMKAVGMRLAAAGHPGGAALINAAEKIEQKQAAEKRVSGMRTQVTPDPQEVEQAADQGTAAPTGGGLFSSMMSSPYVGEDARRMQSQLDREGKGANPDDYLKRLDALATAHRAAAEKESQRAFQSAMKNEEPLVAVIRDGKAVMLPRSQAVGLPPANAGAVAQPIPDAHKDMHGDDYLSTLPTGMGQLVKSIAEGKVDPSKAASMRYGNREAIMQRVLQYDPTYNQTRPKVYADFTTGKTAQNITSMNTVVAHMGTVSELADALKNGNLQTANAVVNRIRTEFGKPEINNTEIAIQAMGNELMRVFRQVGAAQHEVESWEKKFNAAKGSPEQLNGALKVAGELLKGRLEAVNDQWKRGMGTENDYPVLSDKSKAALAKIGVVGAGIPLSSPSAPAAASTPRRKWNPATGKVE
jgi:hypothetical protein